MNQNRIVAATHFDPDRYRPSSAPNFDEGVPADLDLVVTDVLSENGAHRQPDFDHAATIDLTKRLSDVTDGRPRAFVVIRHGRLSLPANVRNIPWSALPVVLDPAWHVAPSPHPVYGHIPGMARWYETWPRSTALSRVRRIVSVFNDERPEARRRISLEARTFMGQGVPVIHLDADGILDAAAYERPSPTMRFDASYAANLRFILPKFVEEARRIAGVPQDMHSSYAGIPGTSYDDPLTIQILYALAAGSLDSVFGDDPVEWNGSGRHPPVEIARERFDLRMRFLAREGLVVPHENTPPLLSNLGRTLLSLLPNECEDADVLLRWKGRTDPDAYRSADEWIVRYFGRLKRKAPQSGARPQVR